MMPSNTVLAACSTTEVYTIEGDEKLITHRCAVDLERIDGKLMNEGWSVKLNVIRARKQFLKTSEIKEPGDHEVARALFPRTKDLSITSKNLSRPPTHRDPRIKNLSIISKNLSGPPTHREKYRKKIKACKAMTALAFEERDLSGKWGARIKMIKEAYEDFSKTYEKFLDSLEELRQLSINEKEMDEFLENNWPNNSPTLESLEENFDFSLFREINDQDRSLEPDSLEKEDMEF